MSHNKIISLWAALIMTILGFTSFTAMAEDAPGSLTFMGSTTPIANAKFLNLIFTSSGYAYVPDAGNPAYVGSNTILIYNVDNNGMLTPHTPASASIGTGNVPSSIVISPTGQHAYVIGNSNTYTCAIYNFFIDNTGNLTPLSNTVVSTVGGCFNNPAFAVSGKYLYMPWQASGTGLWLNTYSVGDYDGNLTLVNSMATQYQSKIIIPSGGKFAYLQSTSAYKEQTNNIISMYNVEPITGQLIPLNPSAIALPNINIPSGAAFDPSNKYLYITNPTDSTILMYSKVKGVLTPLSPASIVTKSPSNAITTSKTGYLYVYNAADLSISTYCINETTGQLKLIDTISTPMTPISGISYIVSMSTNPAGTNLYVDVAQFFGQQGRYLASQIYVYKINGVK